MILSKAQAQVVGTAMIALNEIGGHLDVLIPANDTKFEKIRVHEKEDGTISVGFLLSPTRGNELYANQNAFLEAYSN
jgi:hypothetical protein